MLQLEDVLVRLWRAEINVIVTLQTAPPAHLSAVVDLGDGEELWEDFSAQGPTDEIARWLDGVARKHFAGRYA